MGNQTMPVGELIYEAEIQFTNVIEFGVSMEDLALEKMAIPLEGARFDQEFHGVLRGPKLTGTMTGTDHLYVRADGCFQLHLHARVATEDGANIAFSSQGVSLQIEGEKLTQIRAAGSLFSSSPKYTWLNRLQVWAMGTLDLEAKKAIVSGYAAPLQLP